KWSEVDPSLPDEKIIVFTREAGSGTRGTFEEHVMEPFGLTITPDAQEVPSNPAMRESVRNTQYSIGYVGLGFVTEDVVTVNLAVSENETYYEPTPENIYAGKYPISRYLYLVTNGWPESGSLVDRFIDFIRSPEGQRIVEDQGFLALPKYPPST
ncbi:MAG: substrate-binding domain-containing protein, partial [Candidatus Baldrarchaeia archaeon]